MTTIGAGRAGTNQLLPQILKRKIKFPELELEHDKGQMLRIVPRINERR